MPRNITFTIIIYCEPEHKNILFIRKFASVDKIVSCFPAINKHFIYNIFKKKPKKVGRITQEKLSCVEIMRCEVDKTGMHNFSFWNKTNNIEEFSDSDEDSK